MKPRDIKTLMLLEAIEKDGNQSQRELAGKLDISLGQVNKIIKELSVEEIIKNVKFENKGVKYIVTPKGIREKAKLTLSYFSHSVLYYRDIKRRLRRVLSNLENSQILELLIYGAGDICEIACTLIKEKSCFKVNVIDDAKAGTKICGTTVQSEADIGDVICDAIVIMQLENTDLLRKKLIAYGIPSNKIICIS
jgi:DNA-binding Lrp family transcriptional regulator